MFVNLYRLKDIAEKSQIIFNNQSALSVYVDGWLQRWSFAETFDEEN